MSIYEISITNMNERQLLSLDQHYVTQELSKEAIIHLFKVFNGHWKCDDDKIPKYHAKLKSGYCSDEFFYSEAVLKHKNIREIIANQLIGKYCDLDFSKYKAEWKYPSYISGIPKGGKYFENDMAEAIGCKKAEIEKTSKGIFLNTVLQVNETLLIVDDVCTKGTALRKVVISSFEKDNKGYILPFLLVFLNRSGLKEIEVKEVNCIFDIVSLITVETNEWEQTKCPLCEAGSKPIKPKETEKNWQIITNSQL